MSDLIRRQDAIDALGDEPEVWNETDAEWAERDSWVLHKVAIESLPSAEVAQGWIPVSERLPEDEKIVLITDDGGIVRMMSHEYIPNGGYWFTAEESIMVGESEILAWMPLPPAYHGE